jgi:hypothetical protein
MPFSKSEIAAEQNLCCMKENNRPKNQKRHPFG